MHKRKGKGRSRAWRRGALCLSGLALVAMSAFAQDPGPIVTAPVYILGFRSDASGVSFKNVVLTPSGCLFDYAQLGDQVEHYGYPCHLVSATAPIGKETQRGAFSIRFDLPGGEVTQNFVIARAGDIRLDTSKPGPLTPFDLVDQFHFSSAPPYKLGDIEVAPIPPRSAPPPAAKPMMVPLHLHLDGFDCSLRLGGRAAAPCAVAAWSKNFIGLEVNGDALGLPETIVSFSAIRDASGRWTYQPFYPSKGATAGNGFTHIVSSSTMDPAVTTSYVATHVFVGHTASETVDVVLSDKDCAYRENSGRSIFDSPLERHLMTFPCEITADRPSPHPSFFQDHDYGILVSLPQGQRYLQILAVPKGPGLDVPPGIPALESGITEFEPYPLPPSAELDIPGEPPVHLSVNGLDCTLSAVGHGSFPCRLSPTRAGGLSVDVDTLYLDPWGDQGGNFSLTHLLTGWVMGGDPKKMFRFGVPNPPDTPATPRQHHPHPAPEPGKIEKKVLGPILEPLIGGLSGHYNPGPRPKPPSEPGVRDIALLGFQTGPTAGFVSYFGLAGAALPAESVRVMNLRTGEHKDADVEDDGRFWVDVPGAMDDLYAISFDVPGKDGPRMYQRGDDPPLGLLQPSSVANDTSETMGDDMMSMGSYSGPADVGVVVGGQVATLDHGVFLANNVSLKPGENTIPVTITALGGWKLTKRFTIKSKGKWPVRLIVSADLRNPLTMNFSYGGVVALPLRKLTVASNWADTPSLTLDDPAAGATLSHAYASHGLYPVQLRVTDAQDVTYMVERPVLVPDPAEVDARTRAAWRYFLAALASRDRQAVMSAVTTDGQKQLKNKVDDLLQGRDKLPDRGLPLVRETSAGHALSYAVGEPGSTLHVGFKQDSDGVWRIDSLD